MSLQRIRRRSGPQTIALLFLLLAIGLLLFPQSARVDHQRDCRPEPTDDLIAYGDVVRCVIDPVGDIDVFRFQGVAGESAAIQVTRLTGSISQEPCFRLINPDGTSREVCSPSQVARGDFPLTQTGTYTIQVYEFNHNNTLPYELNLQRTVPPLSPISIRFGDNLNGEINHFGDIDFYLFGFKPVPGDAVIVQVTRRTGSISQEPCFRLINPDGTSREVCSPSQVARGEFQLTQTGTYTIQVYEFSHNNTLPYAIFLQCIGVCMPLPSISLIPASQTIVAGTGGTLTATISAAQSTATTVALTSSNHAIASVPSSAVITENTTSVPIPVMGVSAGSATITATLPAALGGGSASASVRVVDAAQIEITPVNPTPHDDIAIKISGTWPDACTPQNPQVSLVGNEIRIATSNPDQTCAQVLTSWSHTLAIGKLAAGTYQVIVTFNAATELGRKTFVVTPRADLAITKTASPNPAVAGANLTYTITVTNNGPDPAESVTATDNLPASTTFDSCSSTGGGVCGGSGNNRTVTFTSLASSASATITLVARANCSVGNGAAISNTATVGSSTSDPNPGNNSATATTIASNPAKISPTSQSFSASGGTGGFDVTAPSSCSWAASLGPNDSWITVSAPGGGSGDGKVSFSVAANTSGLPRMGEIKINGLGDGLAFKVTQEAGRIVRVVSTSMAQCGAVSVPIELVAQGDENTLGFSLTFDPALLTEPQAKLGSDASGALLHTNSSQVAQGRLGIALALPAGQTFAAGARQLVIVTFSAAATSVTTGTSTTIGFSDQPIAREVISASAIPLSPTAYIAGTVAVCPGLEADATPRPNGNGTVAIADWVQVGRFAAGLDTSNVGSEFQRADCAPKTDKGDGQLTLADWVQAGRYAAGLDPVVPAGGPTSPGSTLVLAATATGAVANANSEVAATRIVRALRSGFEPGGIASLTIELEAQGNENALGFSLIFDPTQSRFVSAVAGSGASGAALNINASQSERGRVGIALALPAGQRLAAGRRQIVVITFAEVSQGGTNSLAIRFGDHPIAREMVDASANALTVIWTPSSVANVSAASFSETELASEAIAAAFGNGLAIALQTASTLPLPTSLAGTTVKLRDSANVERLAPLFFISPHQINYQIPPGTATGTAAVTITSGDGIVSVGTVEVSPVAPGLFTANADGQGISAAVIFRVKADGAQSYEPVAQFDLAQNRFVAVPIDLGSDTDQVFLILSGTGIRFRSSLAAVSAKIGEADVQVLYAGAQGYFIGLDQVNVLVPRSLIGRGEVDVTVTVDGKAANTVRVNIK